MTPSVTDAGGCGPGLEVPPCPPVRPDDTLRAGVGRGAAVRPVARRAHNLGMPLPIPTPSAVLGLTRSAVGSAVDTAGALAALPGRAFEILDGIEATVRRVDLLLARVETVVERTEDVVDRADRAVDRVEVITTSGAVPIEEASRLVAAAGVVITEAESVAARAAGAVSRAETAAGTAQDLLAAYAGTLRDAAPMARHFVEQLSREEVDAAVRIIDELPRVTQHLVEDILPILSTLDRVGPDIHDLLNVTRDLRHAIAGIPGLAMLRRRGEDRLADVDRAVPEQRG